MVVVIGSVMVYSGGMKNLTTKQFGELTVMSLSEIRRYKSERNTQTKAYWNCKCSCGESKVVRGEHLTSGRTVSCGASFHNKRGDHLKLHGLSGTPEHKAWMYMRTRLNSNEPHKVKYYGKVGQDKRWDNFTEFLDDMGTKPTPEHELDRIDPFLPYCKENCRWATRSEQMQNTKRHYQ